MTSCGEFNFYSDAEAAHIVLSSFKCPIVIVPWETGLESSLSLVWYPQKFQHEKTNKKIHLIFQEWRFDAFKDAQNPAVQLLNEAEKIVHQNREYFSPCDAYLTAAFLFPEKCIIKRNFIRVSVEIQGDKTRAQMILDHLSEIEPNATIIEQLNVNALQNAIYWTGFP